MSIINGVKQLMHSKHMLSGVCLASFLESTVVPIPLELMLLPVMQKRRERLWLIAGVTTIGCMIGALAGYAVGFYLFEAARDLIMQYVTNEAQFEAFKTTMETKGFWYIFSTGVTPLPLQLAMLAAGVTEYSLLLYMVAVTSSRIVRYFGLAILVYYFGEQTEKLIRKYKWQTGVAGILVMALFISLQFWTNI